MTVAVKKQNTIYNSLRHDTKNYVKYVEKRITEESYQLPAITAIEDHDRRTSIT